MDAGDRLGGDTLETAGEVETRDSSVESAAGTPSWPIPIPEASPMPPPVGMNWGVVAQHFGADVRVLMHGGYIVLRGEFVPETGYFIDPRSLRARRVDVGQRVLEHGYLIGRLTADEFRTSLQLLPDGEGGLPNAVIRTARGPVIGLFAQRRDAERCRDSILSGAVGAGLVLEDGPLGAELRVAYAEQAGQVATAIASNAGAVISVGGEPIQGGTTPA